MDVWINLPDGEQRTYEDVEDYVEYDEVICFTWNGWDISFEKMHTLMIATRESSPGLRVVQ